MIIKKIFARKNPPKDEEEDDDDDKMDPITARPRRMSEISVKKSKKPIPKGSAFFIFSHTNR